MMVAFIALKAQPEEKEKHSRLSYNNNRPFTEIISSQQQVERNRCSRLVFAFLLFSKHLLSPTKDNWSFTSRCLIKNHRKRAELWKEVAGVLAQFLKLIMSCSSDSANFLFMVVVKRCYKFIKRCSMRDGEEISTDLWQRECEWLNREERQSCKTFLIVQLANRDLISWILVNMLAKLSIWSGSIISLLVHSFEVEVQWLLKGNETFLLLRRRRW